MKRKLAAVSLTILVLMASMVHAAPAKKPRAFKAEGHVYGVMIPPVTWYEFALTTCPNMPSSQGVTSYVIELPRPYSDGTPAVVDTVATFPQDLSGGLGLAFFTEACESNGTDVAPAPLPPGTRFVLVHDLFRVNFDFTITVQRVPPPR